MLGCELNANPRRVFTVPGGAKQCRTEGGGLASGSQTYARAVQEEIRRFSGEEFAGTW